MGMPYGSIPRKTVPRAEEERAMDFSVLLDFEVRTTVSMHLHYDIVKLVSFTLKVKLQPSQK